MVRLSPPFLAKTYIKIFSVIETRVPHLFVTVIAVSISKRVGEVTWLRCILINSRAILHNGDPGCQYYLFNSKPLGSAVMTDDDRPFFFLSSHHAGSISVKNVERHKWHAHPSFVQLEFWLLSTISPMIVGKSTAWRQPPIPSALFVHRFPLIYIWKSSFRSPSAKSQSEIDSRVETCVAAEATYLFCYTSRVALWMSRNAGLKKS